MNDLGPRGPFALWVRGNSGLLRAESQIAIVGARAATGYGEHVTVEKTAGLVYELRKRMKVASDSAVDAAVEIADTSERPIRPEVLEEVKSQGETWIGRLEIWSTADLSDPTNEVTQFQVLRRIQLDAERDALRDAYERGAYSSEAIDVLRTALDSEEILLDAVDGRVARG